MSRTMSVKRIFSFSSGTLNRLGMGFAIASVLQQLHSAAGGLDLGACARAHRVRTNGYLALDRAVPQQLDPAALAEVHEPVRVEYFGRDVIGLYGGEVPHVHDLVDRAEGVLEAALRDAPLERHLATLEPRVDGAAGAGLLTLVALARRLAQAGAG